jgi:GNAT superfamily N-acetyltransferase
MQVVDGPREGSRAVVVTHLQMHSPAEITASPDLPGFEWERIEQDKAARSRWCYETVGAPWHWVDRLTWSDEQWHAWTDRTQHHLFTLSLDSQIVGYVELEQQDAGDVEIAYLGLLPGHSGSGRGGLLLTRALHEAWQLPRTRRVWVHTCDLDAPAALANYRSRGMREFARTVEWRLRAPDTVNP